MATTPSLNFEHLPGQEIPTKYKETIRQLHWVAKLPVCQLATRYKLNESIIRRVLSYATPERFRPGRVGPKQKLTDLKMDEIIEYCSEKWDNRIMCYDTLIKELELLCAASTLRNRLHQRGYYCCTACQKPFLTAAQVIGRFIWAIVYIF